MTESTQIEIEVYINGTAYSVLSNGTDSKLGIRSIGDALTAGALHTSGINTSVGIVCSNINFQTLAMPNGIVLNGYTTGSGKTSDRLSISHNADLSGLDYMDVSAEVKRLFLP